MYEIINANCYNVYIYFKCSINNRSAIVIFNLKIVKFPNLYCRVENMF